MFQAHGLHCSSGVKEPTARGTVVPVERVIKRPCISCGCIWHSSTFVCVRRVHVCTFVSASASVRIRAFAHANMKRPDALQALRPDASFKDIRDVHVYYV